MPFPELQESPLRPDVTLNYMLWTPNTTVQFANVPWGSDYRDIVKFNTRADLDTYITNQNGPRVENLSYSRVNEPIDLDVSFTTTQNYNYIRVWNDALPSSGNVPKAYYYFIADSEFIAGNNTRVIVQLDVWQTYGYDIEFGNAFIEQGHIGIANVNNFAEYGRRYLTVPEGLDVGGEYVIDDIYSHKIGTARGAVQSFDILVQSTVDFTADLGTFDDPKMVMSSGNFAENLPNGIDIYMFPGLQTFKEFLAHYRDKPHAIQGIISITAIPRGNYGIESEIVSIGPGNLAAVRRLTQGSLDNKQVRMKDGWRDNIGLPNRYRNLNKFKTYPYTVLELTTNTGTPLLCKPESWQDANATVNEIPHFASSSARVMFSPHQYNAATNALSTTDANGIVRDAGEFLDMATGIFNFPTFMIANDGAKLYLANNKNSVAYQNRSADWSQTRAMAGNQLSSDQATVGIGASQTATNIGISASQASTNITNDTAVLGAGLSAVTSGLGGIAGGPMGIGAGLANGALGGLRTAMDISARNQQLGVSTGAALAQNANSTGAAGYMRDTNKAYADAVAQGDYQMAIAGIQAKVQDAMLTQPSTVGQVGGESFLLARYQWGVDLRVKLLDPAAMVAVGEYWLRYGYRVNRFANIPESLKVMTHFTYWKLKETYITSSRCPESFKQTIRGIFEKGVTVWNNPNDIGRIDNGINNPIPGVTL